MMIYIELNNYYKFYHIIHILKKECIYSNYGISHIDKWNMMFNKSKSGLVYIRYEDELVHIHPMKTGKPGGNMYYANFSLESDVFEQNPRAYNPCSYKIVSYELFICEHYLNKLEVKIKENE